MMRFLQRLGKSLMLPVACLPIGGILMGIGYWIDPAGWGANSLLAMLLIKAGGILIDNMAILFALGVAVGMSKDQEGTSALAAIISWCIALPLGILAAVKRNRMADRVVRVVALLGVSVPGFALSILVILVLSLFFGYYPPLNYVGLLENPAKNLEIMFLPALILGCSMSGSVMRMTRSSVLEVLRQDFIKTVRAKGASERVAIFKHALRNALIPIVTLVGLQIGSLLGGAVVVEQIFSLPGLGLMTLTGINNRDYPVVQGCVLFIAFVYVLVNLVVDLLYAYIDPRISYD